MSSNLNNQFDLDNNVDSDGTVNNQVAISDKPSDKTKEQDSFVKLAMRNMVKKGSTSLFHLLLTVLGVVGTLLGLAIAFH